MTTTWNSGDLVNITLSGANLVATGNSASDGSVRAVANSSTDKLYYECTVTTAGGGNTSTGIANGTANLSTAPNSALLVASAYNGGNIWVNGSALATIGAATAGDVYGIALDAGAKLIWIRRNLGSWNNNTSADPATGVGGLDISGFSGPYFPWFSDAGTGGTHGKYTANFGDTAYTNGPPSGFSSWGAGSTSITVHCGALLESLRILGDDNISIIEFLDSVKRESEIQAEFTGTSLIRMNASTPIELSALSNVDLIVPLESLRSISAENSFMLEKLYGLSFNDLSEFETLSAVVQHEYSVLESTSRKTRDYNASIENLVFTKDDNPAPLESLTSFIVVQNDSSVPIEFCMIVTQQFEDGIPLESLIVIKQDEDFQLEVLRATKRDGDLPFEWGGAISVLSDSSIPLENLIRLNKDLEIPIEETGTAFIRNDASIPIESLANTKDDSSSVIEDLAAYRDDNSGQVDGLSGISRHGDLPAEELAAQRTDIDAPIEITGAVTIHADAVLPIESNVLYRDDSAVPLETIVKVVRDSDIQVESLFSTRGDNATQSENTGTTSIASQSDFLIESTASTRDDNPGVTESISNLKRDIDFVDEVIVSIRRDVNSLDEFLLGLRNDTSSNQENTGTTLVLHNAAQTEFFAILLIRRNLQSESTVNIRFDISPRIESLIGVRRDSILEQENLGTTQVQRDTSSNLEWLGLIITDELSEIETILHTTIMQSESALIIEFSVDIRTDTNTPFEQIESPILIKIIKAISKVLRMTTHIRLVGPK